MQYKIEETVNLDQTSIYTRPFFRVTTIYDVYERGFSTFFMWRLVASFDSEEEAKCFIEEQE